MAKTDIKKVIDSIESGDNVAASDAFAAAMVDKQREAIEAVSYTHLTLPTKRIV